jgi:tetratricopeptide (TPR) repeat protein
LPAALALAQTVADAAGDSPQLRESRIEGLDEAMHNQWRLGEFELAEATAHQVLALAHEAAREHWVEPSMYDRLAEICLSRKGFDEAERLARRSMEMIDRVGCRNTSFTSLNFVLARALAGQGKPAEANRAFQQVWQQSDALNLRDEASLAFYEWMAAARSGSDPRFLEDAARCVLAQLATYDESTMDGLHLAWRAMAHGALKGEKAAASDWIRAFEKGLGEDKAYCQLALALLQQGDHATYQRICNELVAKVGTAANEHTSQRIAWTCALGSQPVDDLSVPLDLAANLVEKNPGVATYLCTSGALLYRLGRYEEADGRLRQSIEAFKDDDAKWLSALYPQFFLAMTRWQLGHEADARSLLADLQSQMSDATYSAGPWYRRATLDILRRETEGLITGGSNTRPLPKGEGFESKLGERNED